MPSIDFKSFKQVSSIRVEANIYEPLIAALLPFLKEGWKMAETSNSPDPNSVFFMNHQIKPDVSIYSTKEPTNDNLCRACDMETFIEVKTKLLSDAFTDELDNLEKNSGDARDTRGQIITYLNAMQAAQYRTHGFGVLIVKDICRLLRHTHSGIEVTTSFHYTKSSHLQTFFWRFSHAAPAVRGIDTTFEPVERWEAFPSRLLLNAVNEPLWKVDLGERSFYVAAPFTRTHHYPVGRGTRCFVAVDCRTRQKCLLKDVWRVHGYHREGDVYARLHAHNVRNIANVLAAGDVDGHQRCGSFPEGWHIPSVSMIREHIHYRIVLDVVGEPLVDFESTHALTQYVFNALEAHFDAVNRAHVEHRDISVGNIIIVRKSNGSSVGFLIDWELAKYLEDKGARAYERTGTRQFMSARLCVQTPPLRTLGDDLESFALLLFWIAARYAPNRLSAYERALFLDRFDHNDDTRRVDIFLSGKTSAAKLLLVSEYFEELLAILSDGYAWRYRVLTRLERKNQGALEELKEKQDLLETHQWFMDVLSNTLKKDTWKAIKDRSAKEQEVARLVVKEGEKKRKSGCSEYELTYASKRRRHGEHGPDTEEDSDEKNDVKEGCSPNL
ncbi:uncharacterized protein EV420DRAFT_1275459 [Desarmillaria tabescens]|uniref:Protein kinase domain-containing protein n=1 Tax=Armillaria tabescens TaxID=1929756 RepID=A0AA39JUC3_ARMTA|nr:uncharacterized protein EV420DRAFT_1275459 [Desarmillaria tabescens]KAK0449076.1 hypothetical protein EV420DRAFT_1275459 [Desarmillaria tabescens]